MACLQAFTSQPDGFTLSQISRRLNVNPATASRVCGTLIDLGFLQRDDQKRYHLTPRVLSLGYSYLSSLPNSPYIQHSLAELCTNVNEPVSLGVLVGEEQDRLGDMADLAVGQAWLVVFDQRDQGIVASGGLVKNFR